jgi:hypothetical protein
MKFTAREPRSDLLAREPGRRIITSTLVSRTTTGGRTIVMERGEGSATEQEEAPNPVDHHLDQAVRAALKDERPKAVAAWLRRVATSVERGDYEE